MYAITQNGFRAITSRNDVREGETFSDVIPADLALSMRKNDARALRNDILRATDWSQLPDTSLTAIDRTAYAVYRQALRDLPQLPGFPDVEWPSAPPVPANSGDEYPEVNRT